MPTNALAYEPSLQSQQLPLQLIGEVKLQFHFQKTNNDWHKLATNTVQGLQGTSAALPSSVRQKWYGKVARNGENVCVTAKMASGMEPSPA